MILAAVHHRCGKVHKITEVIEYSQHYIKCISDGITVWYGIESYNFIPMENV
jgi:hypothetical protein